MKKNATLLLCVLLYACYANAQWSLTGNAGTNPATNFVGTTDNKPLRFRANNTWEGELNPTTYNIFLGSKAGMNSSSGGVYNVGIGHQSLFSNTSGELNTAIGNLSMYSNVTGVYNTAVGFESLLSNSNGSFNTAVGEEALRYNTSGGNNAAFGQGSMYQNTTGYANTAIGNSALRANISGNNNTASGWLSLSDCNYGSYNVAIGGLALESMTGAYYNTVVGYNAGSHYDLGYNNVILGANCDGSFAGQYNIIAIGQGVTCPDNSTARIGNSATWSIGGYASWSSFSDGRYKKDIQENVKGLEFIMKLRPVTYHLNITALSARLRENHGEEWNTQMKTAMADKEKTTFTGFVAQEVEKAANDAGYDFSGVDKPKNDSNLYALRYSEFVVPLVKAMQEQQQMIADLQKNVQSLQEQADITILLRETFAADKISAYPDPVSNNMTVNISTQQAGNGTIQIFDNSGRLVKQMNIAVQSGTNAFNLSVPSLAAGNYILKIDWGTNMHKQLNFMKTNQ